MHDPDAVLDDIIAHLVPEAFDRPTCAERVAREPVVLVDLPRRDAPAVFERWVDDRLLEALERGAYASPLTVVTTSDGHLLRRYVDCGCGQVPCAVEAARSEVHDIAQPWVFAADLVRPAPVWETVRGDDGQLEEVLTVPDDLTWYAPWFAEARGHGMVTTRAGVLALHGEVVVDTHRLPPRQHPVTRRFHRLLFRHPARRRFPLR